MPRYVILLLQILAASSFIVNFAYAGDAAAGKIKFSTCEGCHSVEKYFNVYPSYRVPKLGGQHEAYIQSALQSYKNGDRAHETMRANAANLSKEDIADIAAYLAQKDVFKGAANNVRSQDPVARGKEKAATCAACHGKDGNSAAPTFPIIAGQHADYITQSLKQYKSGTRKNAIMAGSVAGLSEDDMKDLGAYFAAQTGLEPILE